MSRSRVVLLTVLALLAFAGNSLLCRMALQYTSIDAASFTSVRLVAGALVLWLLVRLRHSRAVAGANAVGAGNWLSALALFAYAAGFSFAYISLPTGTGALILFGAVQATMIGFALFKGERLQPLQSVGLLLAIGGLVGLLLPGLSAPPLLGAMLMVGAGVAWGVYSLRGKGAGDPTRVTAGNFLRTVPMTLLLSVVMTGLLGFSVPATSALELAGIGYAVASGALASGLGYAVWYSVLPALKSATAASVQLSVPVLAAVAGVVFLGEPITLRLALASIAILGGIALVVLAKPQTSPRRIDPSIKQ